MPKIYVCESPPLVTVSIPLYNKAASIKRAVESVLSQTYSNLELNVVDDGSDDGSADILREVDDHRLQIISQDNLGPGAARNRGWQVGAGPLAAFLDADDFWDADFLEWAVARLAMHPEVAAVTAGYRESHGWDGIRPAEELRRGLRAGVFHAAQADVHVFMMALAYMLPVTTVVRREVLQEYGGFFDRGKCTYGEDNFLWTQVLLNYPVYFGVEAKVTVDRCSSELSVVRHLPMRAIEPLLTHTSIIVERCPAHLKPLLEEVLTARAFKRACTLAATGRWREARALREQYATVATTQSSYRLISALISNPVGSSVAQWAFRVMMSKWKR